MFEGMLKPWPRLRYVNDGTEARIDIPNAVKIIQLGCPRKFLDARIDRINAMNMDQVNLMNAMNEMITAQNPRKALIAAGVNSSGKTHIGCGLVNYLGILEAANERWDARYVNESDLMDRVTGYGRTRDWFGEYTDLCRLLVIDEFGSNKWTPSEMRRIDQVLNKRFNNGLQTVLLSNLTFEQVHGLMSSSVSTRFNGCWCVRMTERVDDYGRAEEEGF